MRMMLKVQIPVDTGSQSIKDGSMQHVIEQTLQRIRPEAVYFFAEDGMRTAIAVFDMKDNSEMVTIAEPIFAALEADVHFTPVMSLDDLKQGLSRIG